MKSNQFPQGKPKVECWKLVDKYGNIYQNTFGPYAVCVSKKNTIPKSLRNNHKIVPYK